VTVTKVVGYEIKIGKLLAERILANTFSRSLPCQLSRYAYQKSRGKQEQDQGNVRTAKERSCNVGVR
jgi:hypothetical protein